LGSYPTLPRGMRRRGHAVHVFPVAFVFVEALWRTEPPKLSGLHKRIMKDGKNPPYPGEHPPRPHAHLSLTNIMGGTGRKTTGLPDVGVPTPTHLQRDGPVPEVYGTLLETVSTHTEFMAGPFLGCLYARGTGTTWDRSWLHNEMAVSTRRLREDPLTVDMIILCTHEPRSARPHRVLSASPGGASSAP
jgi:hypothetical protein